MTMLFFFSVPPLSVDNIMAVLRGLEERWTRVGRALGVPRTVRDQIKADSSSDHDGLKSLVRYWVQRDPLASWRRLIWLLEKYGGGLEGVAESIMNYAEKLRGQWTVG